MASFPLTFARRSSALGLAAVFLVAAGARGGTVQTLNGDVFEGDIHLDAGALNVEAKGQPAQRVELANILRADFQEKGKADNASSGVQLRNGTVIGGKVLGLDAMAVHLSIDRVAKDFPLATVARIIFEPLPDQVARKVPAGFVGAILPGGDLFAGECRGMEENPPAVKVNSAILGVHRFDYAKGGILALAIHDLALNGPESYRVRAVDGSQYSVGSLQLSTDGVTLRDPVAGDVKIPAKQLAQIAAGEARVEPLGGLRAAAVQSVNPAKVPATFSADIMPAGGPISLAGQTYDGGIVQSAGVAVTYLVPAGFSVFTAKVGLAAGAPGNAAVFYSLLADNRVVWKSPQAVTAGAPPVPVRWNLGTGVRALSLYVEAAQPASLGTAAIWADATLFKP